MQVTEITSSHTVSGLPAPAGWHTVPWPGSGFMWERLFGSRISVIEDVSAKADGRNWLHVSVGAPKNRLPSYEELQAARKAFIGNRESYMVFPTEERYVNIGNVLHLWCCLSSPEGVLPHFEGVVNGVMTI